MLFMLEAGQWRCFTLLTDSHNKLFSHVEKASCAAPLVYLKTAFSQCQSPHAELNEGIYSPTESGLEIRFH